MARLMAARPKNAFVEGMIGTLSKVQVEPELKEAYDQNPETAANARIDRVWNHTPEKYRELSRKNDADLVTTSGSDCVSWF
jgi:hypothetical protein